MITAFQIAIERAGWYIGSGWHYLLFAAALLFLILKRDDKENRKWLVGYTLLFAAVYICPLTARIIMKYCIGGFVYWRMFWILPTSVIVAYVAVSVCTAGKKKTVQAVCASLLMALIIVTGKNPYVGGQAIYQKAVNMQKLPADACQISSLIAAARTEGETALAVMPAALRKAFQIRETSAENPPSDAKRTAEDQKADPQDKTAGRELSGFSCR